MADVKIVDIMNYPWSPVPESRQGNEQYKEFQLMAQTTFKSQPMRQAPSALLKVAELTDDLIKERVAAYVKRLDDAGYDRVMMCPLKMWSYWWHHKLITDFDVDFVQQLVEYSGGRLMGAAGYNPFRIDESLRDVEKGVKDYGFKYVYFHPMTFGIAPNDRRCYPLYAKCSELNVAVGFQVGQSAEVLPSNVGHPMLVDDVAIEFPNLRINLSHTGWPWVPEWISMIWRHPNVYGDISAYFPKSLDEEQIRFLNGSRGRDKVMLGTNGLDPVRYKEEILTMGLKEETLPMLMRENVLRFLQIE